MMNNYGFRGGFMSQPQITSDGNLGMKNDPAHPLGVDAITRIAEKMVNIPCKLALRK